MSYRTDKLVIDGHTDTHIHTQATTIPEGQNWPRVKTVLRSRATPLATPWQVVVVSRRQPPPHSSTSSLPRHSNPTDNSSHTARTRPVHLNWNSLLNAPRHNMTCRSAKDSTKPCAPAASIVVSTKWRLGGYINDTVQYCGISTVVH